jgi:hypothetical protein
MFRLRLEIHHRQAERIAAHLLRLNWQSAGFPSLEAALPGAGPGQVLDFFFFNSALLFDFYGLGAELDGQRLKGSDLFFALARRKALQDFEFFTAARLADLSLAEYQAAYALDGDPAHTLINRAEERVAILRELGQGLLRDYQDIPGSPYLAAHLLAACAGRLRTPEGTGLLDRLVKFQGYDDPHLKKAFVLIKALARLGLFDPADREQLFIPVDYHLIRMALRTGLVTITDPALADQLRSRAPASHDDDWELRQVIKLAYKQLEQAAGVDVFVLDEMFWTMGRSCCHYSRPPRCAGCDFTDCSVMTSFTYPCPGRCPLATVCLGARDEACRSLFEPQLVTTYY